MSAILRYLVFRHPRFCFFVLVTAMMAPLRYWIAPAIVGHFGLTGAVVTMAGIYLVAVLMEGRWT